MTDVKIDRNDVLGAARTILDERGIERLTVRAVAQAAGCSTTGIYTHFGGKQQLLDALFAEAFGEFRGAMAHYSGVKDADALSTCLLRYREWALANQSRYLLMFASRASGYQPGEQVRSESRASFDDLVAGVQKVIDADALEGDALRVATHLWATAHGYVTLELTGPGTLGDNSRATYEAGIRAAISAFSR